MGTKKFTVALVVDPTTDGIASASEHKRMLTDSAYGDIDRDHMSNGASVATISSSALASPKNGELRVDTSTTPHTLREYDGATERGIVDYDTSAPSSTRSGALWWDSTLNLLRVYGTRDGIAGWHPADAGFQLMTNRSGSDVTAGAVVIRDTTASSTREFSTTTAKKDPRVVGVAIEAIAAAASGVVALVQSGAVVSVQADNTDDTIAKGDALVTYSTAGKCRASATLHSASIPSEGVLTTGLPLGAFAEALGTVSSGMVSARLLGAVGQGRMRYVLGVPTIADITDMTDSVELEIDASNVPSGTGDIAAEFLPVAAVYVWADVESDGGAGDSAVEVNFKFEGMQQQSFVSTLKGRGDGNGLMRSSVGPVLVPTVATGTDDAQGNTFVVEYENVTGTASVVNVKLLGFIY